MAAAGLARAFRKKGASMTGDMEEDYDTEPAYLVHFPKPPNIVKDTQLGVLLGRQVASKPATLNVILNFFCIHMH
jgi:hypothetical protein